MLNTATGLDDTKYFALVATIATRASAQAQARALERLVDAVTAESARRARCRDTDLQAATRVRAW